MDYIDKFDIELEKEHYYAGEKLRGWVIVSNTENIKVRGIRVSLRGKAHVEWKITRGGERKTVKEDEYLIDEKAVIWGKDKHEEGAIPIMPRGDHKFRFEFELPESSLPCSFESKIGTVRYYLRAVVDIPYASAPQGLKYFTVIGPHIDCMEEKYMTPIAVSDQWERCCLCCLCCPLSGPVRIDANLERSAYCCGERVKLKCEIQNSSDQNVWLICRLTQIVEYHINKGALGLTKVLQHKVLELKTPTIPAHSSQSLPDLHHGLQLPIMPPTMLGVCSVIEIYYVLKVRLGLEKSGEDLAIDLPIEVGTVPFRLPNSPAPDVTHECAADNVEGGIYISPEFQLGQVYDGTMDVSSNIILYRPVYIAVHTQQQQQQPQNADCCDAERSDGPYITLDVDEKCTSV